MRVALERAMARNESALAPPTEPKIPDNHPDSMLLAPGGKRTSLREQKAYAELRSDPLAFELAKEKLEKQLGHPLTVGYHPVSEHKDQGWEALVNGVLMREDLTASQNRRLDKEWNNWLTNHDRKILKSLDRLGVDAVDIDWDYFRASYKK